MNALSKTLRTIPTRKLIWTAFAVVVFAIALDEIKRPLYADFRLLSKSMDCAAFVLGWTGLIALSAGMILGPFRPVDQFSLRGQCGQRAANFGISAAALILILIYSAARIASLVA